MSLSLSCQLAHNNDTETHHYDSLAYGFLPVLSLQEAILSCLAIGCLALFYTKHSNAFSRGAKISHTAPPYQLGCAEDEPRAPCMLHKPLPLHPVSGTSVTRALICTPAPQHSGSLSAHSKHAGAAPCLTHILSTLSRQAKPFSRRQGLHNGSININCRSVKSA